MLLHSKLAFCSTCNSPTNSTSQTSKTKRWPSKTCSILWNSLQSFHPAKSWSNQCWPYSILIQLYPKVKMPCLMAPRATSLVKRGQTSIKTWLISGLAQLNWQLSASTIQVHSLIFPMPLSPKLMEDILRHTRSSWEWFTQGQVVPVSLSKCQEMLHSLTSQNQCFPTSYLRGIKCLWPKINRTYFLSSRTRHLTFLNSSSNGRWTLLLQLMAHSKYPLMGMS